MCGIVGLFLKDSSLEPRLGSLLAGMLEVMTERGPDSAGFAVYGAGAPGRIKLTMRGENLDGLTKALTDALQVGADLDWVTNQVAGQPNDERDLRFGCDAALFTRGVAQYAVRYDFERRTDVDGVSGDDATSHRLMLEMTLDM